MSKIKIITDSTSYITKEYAKDNDISVVQLSYTFGGETKMEGFPGQFDEFFDTLSKTTSFPTTSQPSVGTFVEEYEKALTDYDEVLVLTFSSKLSGTFNSALMAKEMVDKDRITVIDTEQAVGNLKFLVEDAVMMAKKGLKMEEIVQSIESQKEKMEIYLTVDTLEYLRRGGRLSNIKSAIGTILNIKPIIELKDGRLQLLENVRGKKKALNMIIDKVPSYAKRISISHIFNEEEALEFKKIVEERCTNAIVTIDEIGPVIGGHLGPKGIGVCFKY
ncbi:DegV family protein [Anaerosalibacter sp. Marseille-P3206]|uniref:DegV family protein n=1 Tax=Anaerosalibacter sp. Marseille-P3206 TaxID=1871005 RepID=UPI000986654B|nr:DegV family protein [Anaerosalibacter sp. Marseille-P3206]